MFAFCILKMSKIAIISDIHGNLTALEAVVADIKAKKVDEVWVLGDLLMPGPGGKKILELLEDLHPSVYVRGNWDDLLLRGIEGKITLEKQSNIYFSRLAQFYAKELDQKQLAFIQKMSLQKVVKRGALTISITHNLPYLNYGQTLYPTTTQENFDEIAKDSDADLFIYAHVHHQIMRYTIREQLVINPGSIGEPFCDWDKFQADLRAQYITLEVDDKGLKQLDFCKVDYDHQKEYQRAKKAQLPYLELYKEQLEVGRVHTHDQELLAEYNKKYNYEEDVLEYRKKM